MRQVYTWLPISILICPHSLRITYTGVILFFFTIDKNSINLTIYENHRSILGLNWMRGNVLCTYPDRGGHFKADLTGMHVPALCTELYVQTREVISVRSTMQRRYEIRSCFGILLEIAYIYRLINFILVPTGKVQKHLSCRNC